MDSSVVIPTRFRGPPESANGGYTCGLVAELAAQPVEVTLRRPPPLGRPLRWDGSRLFDGEELVAETIPVTVTLELPAPVWWEQAELAAARFPGFEAHAFPTCFVCGPGRAVGDGLRIFAGPVEGRALVAAPWLVPEEVDARLLWAALDCPGAIAVGYPRRGETVLGRFAARVLSVPAPGEQCVVVGWPLGEEGRKLEAGTALFGEGGRVHAFARATWIAPRG